jgi:hypothetical protein
VHAKVLRTHQTECERARVIAKPQAHRTGAIRRAPSPLAGPRRPGSQAPARCVAAVPHLAAALHDDLALLCHAGQEPLLEEGHLGPVQTKVAARLKMGPASGCGGFGTRRVDTNINPTSDAVLPGACALVVRARWRWWWGWGVGTHPGLHACWDNAKELRLLFKVSAAASGGASRPRKLKDRGCSHCVCVREGAGHDKPQQRPAPAAVGLRRQPLQREQALGLQLEEALVGGQANVIAALRARMRRGVLIITAAGGSRVQGSTNARPFMSEGAGKEGRASRARR